MTVDQRLLAAALASSLSAPATLVAETRPATTPPARTAPLTQSQLQERDRRSFQEIVSGEPYRARGARAVCIQDNTVAMATPNPGAGVPDTVDRCIAAMTRQARDGAALAYYEDRVHELAPSGPLGSPIEDLDRDVENMLGARAARPYPIEARMAAALPEQISTAITAGRNQVDLGRGRTLPITSGLALDAGFMGAWANRGEGAPGPVTDEARFRASTEQCLTQQGDNKRCFVLGYVHGARAYESSRRSAAADLPALPTAPARATGQRR